MRKPLKCRGVNTIAAHVVVYKKVVVSIKDLWFKLISDIIRQFLHVMMDGFILIKHI